MPEPELRVVHAVEHVRGELEVDRMAGERVVGDDADQCALERAHVVGDALGDQLEHAGLGQRDAVEHGPLAQDRHAGGEIGRPDVGDEPGLEALSQALLDAVELAAGGGRR